MGLTQGRAGRPHGRGICRSNEARHLLSVTKEHQGGPQLDAKRSAELPSAAVFDLDMRHIGMIGHYRGNDRSGPVAVPAPVGAKVEYQGAGAGLHLGQARLLAGVGDDGAGAVNRGR